jgi:hypothetical protein
MYEIILKFKLNNNARLCKELFAYEYDNVFDGISYLLCYAIVVMYIYIYIYIYIYFL